MGERNRFKRLSIKLVRRKEVWVLTCQGWGVLIVSVLASLTVIITGLHPFLAVTAPIKADALVIEGWLPDYALESALKEFNQGAYRSIVTVGGPLAQGFYLAEYKNFAALSSATLRTLGCDPNRLITVPAPGVFKGRTDASAEAFKQWLTASGQDIHAINLYSFATHARRSWLSFRRTLHSQINVGVIAAESTSYDRQHWWASSEGFRSTLSEAIAYLYERLFA